MPQLIVMRLRDMARIHPEQIVAPCSKCGEECGVFPSGQEALRARPDLALVCSVCKGPIDWFSEAFGLAPGAEREPFETKPKRDA